MSKCDEWFKSLTEAFEKKPSWDINSKKFASLTNPDRDKKLKSTQKKSNK